MKNTEAGSDGVGDDSSERTPLIPMNPTDPPDRRNRVAAGVARLRTAETEFSPPNLVDVIGVWNEVVGSEIPNIECRNIHFLPFRAKETCDETLRHVPSDLDGWRLTFERVLWAYWLLEQPWFNRQGVIWLLAEPERVFNLAIGSYEYPFEEYKKMERRPGKLPAPFSQDDGLCLGPGGQLDDGDRIVTTIEDMQNLWREFVWLKPCKNFIHPQNRGRCLKTIKSYAENYAGFSRKVVASILVKLSLSE